MIVGMGVVFSILLMLVLLIPLAARVIHALEGPPATAGEKKVAKATKKEPPIAAVIAAAINMFRAGK